MKNVCVGDPLGKALMIAWPKRYTRCTAWCADNGYIVKIAREFRETPTAHLGCTYKDMTVHTDKGPVTRHSRSPV